MDGKSNSEQILEQIKEGISYTIGKQPVLDAPRLDMVLIGDDFASQKYVEFKEKAAKKVGIDGQIQRLPSNATKEEIINLVERLNQDKKVTGFMIQLPLPDRSMEEEVLERILPEKDADGLTATNLGRLFQNAKEVKYVAPATSLAVEQLLGNYGFRGEILKSLNVVVLGASKIVGLPIAGLLINKGATVTVCHEYTQNEKAITKKADILISATGIPKLVKADWVKEGVVVVDVGLSKDPETGEVCGDVDFDNVSPKCSHISRVYGGVGPMTVACLMLNTFVIWARKNDISKDL
jgi:methylenetetrahydrofolate dehydrogenase (NADP+)/methenyltetrahydrofolate cyclohydrolase